ncbi:MAG TPA: 50S ribosomal protein L32e [Methylomirabilota bacterium]|nr:50S ribosomal protein L32e [Methylomirabilota bacterium]
MKTYARPKFVRQESWRYKRVKPSWRIARGKSSRVRRSKEGWPPLVKIGYARPASIRGLHPSGMREMLVHRPLDLEQIDPKVCVARIAHRVGENKRLLILDEAERRGIRILNPGPKKEEAAAVTPPSEEEKKETEPTSEAEPKREEPKPKIKKEKKGTK